MTANIFIVEDHEAMQNAYRLLLKQEEEMVLVGMVETGEQALEQLEEVSADLVLVDLSLPGMSGLDFLAALHRRFTELPTLVISGHVEPHYVDSALRNGSRGYIDKKDAAADIIDGIRAVLSGHLYLSTRLRDRFGYWLSEER
ncbi:MAG: response regulator transcription factor [Candidatus Promineifilaceae bacterium]|nr:response regulator transcription factor [Candidatus Promineifilaceae bacterium]